ncbi:MAG: hypothetical protein ACOYM2_18600 [Rectinemataceae bacterium]
MKIIKTVWDFKWNYSAVIMVSALAVSSILMLSGCSTDLQKPENKQTVFPNIDFDPVPLTETEKTLSLVGYGSKGALADNDLTINDMLMYASNIIVCLF